MISCPPQSSPGAEFDRLSADGVAPLMRARMESAGSEGAEHDPHTMLLTCADARILPNLITDSGPGELLNVRNVGNLADASVESAVSYALERLSVHTIAVCGHSGCEAMHDLLHGGVRRGDRPVARPRPRQPARLARPPSDGQGGRRGGLHRRGPTQHGQRGHAGADPATSSARRPNGWPTARSPSPGCSWTLPSARLFLVGADDFAEIDQHGSPAATFRVAR